MKGLAIVIALAAAVVANGCSQTQSTTGPPPWRGVPCPALAVVGPQVLYPIPGATGVPTVAGSFVFAGDYPATLVVDLAPASGPTVDLGKLGAAPSPLPSPEAMPQSTPPAGSTPAPLFGVPYPQLAPATTYTLSYRDTARPCPVAIAGGETFTTQ